MLIRLQAHATDDTGHAVTRARVFGELATGAYPGQSWDVVEPRMAATWDKIRGDSHLRWDDVRDEARAAWQVAKMEGEGRLRDFAPVDEAA